MSVATGFFELFDYLLTYLSNSLWFLRIGVFAVSHAAMMQVVMTLSGAENGGSANLLIVIIGNVIVVCMEGLIVGIQVLRLEYYEMFGRFYEGSGREFVAYIVVLLPLPQHYLQHFRFYSFPLFYPHFQSLLR